ncbi:type II toxin-antitoxin system CcdA family antitoxin [Sphingomonas sp.]|uniref:type II toxin-antitoxin system CcdA family antitoxin n=1 Tax=Sphingomonas sp. TaxID=28214 RepID=UPI002C474EFF|nr:type II toxin-antitoxin system CcdA family antitoxin [Sphingomonas sp.]HWK36273.1 type II toxin-antitoxin system CcdA family antitoxin [Sphingomonas sp.]
MNAPAKVETRRATNVTLDTEAVAEAKALDINVSRACEAGLKAEIRRVRDARWIEDNRAAMESWNDWVEQNGLPLGHLRQF